MPVETNATLLEFLNQVQGKGLMNGNHARSLRSACAAVFSILDDDEDIFALDLDGVCDRFENLKGMEVTPNTMRAYRQRVKQAVSEFRRYRENPSQWKPAGTRRASRKSNKSPKESAAVNNEPRSDAPSPNPDLRPTKVDDIVHNFPLRRDVIVQISGLPFDVTRSEMGRMTAFLSNLVAVTEESESVRPMLNAAGSNCD